MGTFARSAWAGLLTPVLSLTGAAVVGMTTPSAVARPFDEPGVGGAIPKGLMLLEAPAGAKSISEVMDSAKVGEAIVVRGRIATGKDAFKEGRAVFTIVEPRPAASRLAKPEAGNPEPAPAATPAPADPREVASVQLVDDKGRVIRTDLKNKRGLRSGAEILVVGKVAEAGGAGVLVVSASGIYIMPTTLPNDLFLKDEPKDAKSVEEVKRAAKVGDIVAMRGRVGGSKEPFVEGRAVFTLMGPGLKACGEGTEMDSCKTPWDYCCETKKAIAEHSATVQIVESDGSPIKAGVKGQGGIKQLSDLIIVGKVVQADGKTLLVSATGVYIAKP